MKTLRLLLLIVATSALADNPLSPCPRSPNCVSSLSSEEESHRMAPFEFKQTLENSQLALQKAIESFERAKIVSRDTNLWKCEFKTKILGFVDDVEFFFDIKSKKIHVRSASRLGYSDLGTNRERVERLRELYQK